MNNTFLKHVRASFLTIGAAIWVTAAAQAAPAQLTPDANGLLAPLGQSPIDIITADAVYYDLQDPIFTGTSPTKFSVFKTAEPIPGEYTLRANVNDPYAVNQVWVEAFNKPFQLLQLHMHAPSEHLINGVESEMELHLVHKSADGQLLVVGRMVEMVPTLTDPTFHSALYPMISLLNGPLPTVGWDPSTGALDPVPSTAPMVNLDMMGLVHVTDGTTYRYSGGLTTSPYTPPSVYWMIMNEHLKVSEGEIAAFKAAFPGHAGLPGNVREVQPLNGRFVYTDVPPIPEPETYMMMLVGLGLLGLIVRRRTGHTS